MYYSDAGRGCADLHRDSDLSRTLTLTPKLTPELMNLKFELELARASVTVTRKFKRWKGHGVCVYYCSTYYKAVRVGGGGG
jgi:hypothetical protein